METDKHVVLCVLSFILWEVGLSKDHNCCECSTLTTNGEIVYKKLGGVIHSCTGT